MASPTACAKLIVFLSAACLAARSATAEAEPVMRMLAALGGTTAIDKLTSLSVEADCTGPSGPFRTSVQSLRPGRVYFIQTSDKGTTRIWSTPTRTWTVDGGKVETLGEGVRAFVRGHEFHLLLFEVHSRFPKREAGGDEVLDGRAFTRVLMTDQGGDPATLLLDKTSFLPRRLELNPPGAQGPIRIFFDDWRRIGGLLYFESFRLTEGPDRTFAYRYTKIAPNTVEASLFTEPAAPNSSRPE
jgi:hypothetical protein